MPAFEIDHPNPFRRIVPSALILLSIVAIGTVGYMLIEDWPFLEAIYMVVITLFTVGFQEMHRMSSLGMVFTMFIIVAGVGTAVYAGGQIVEIMVEGELLGYRRKRKMEKTVKNMKDHYVICGYGRTGHQVAEEFISAGVPFIVIDRKPETAEKLDPRKIPYIIGDVISDENLERAGIRVAKGLITCADSDVANVYVILSARALNPDLYIISRASEMDSEKKMKMAGANRVISPYYISGRRMATMAVRPVASDFLDTVMHGREDLEFRLGEISVTNNSQLLGKTLAEAMIRDTTGAMVLAIRKKTGKFNLQPQATSTIESGDIFVVIGTQNQLESLEKMI
ncbi:MAG: potassium channel protein [Deltaproteobacteria bacterium]|nr:potassium channel protein [Deltaproteobacteria bacterium]